MSRLPYTDPERLWYEHITAMERAAEFARKTGVRQRVKKVGSRTNIYRCTWLIEEI